jgi:hypothetical protein
LQKLYGTNFVPIKFWVLLTLNVKMDQCCPQLRFFILMVRLYLFKLQYWKCKILKTIMQKEIDKSDKITYPVSLNTRWGAQWPRGQSARRAIAEAKKRSQKPVIRWVTKIYYLLLLRALKGTLSRWSRLQFAVVCSLSSFNEGWGRRSSRRLVVKINCRIFITT